MARHLRGGLGTEAGRCGRQTPPRYLLHPSWARVRGMGACSSAEEEPAKPPPPPKHPTYAVVVPALYVDSVASPGKLELMDDGVRISVKAKADHIPYDVLCAFRTEEALDGHHLYFYVTTEEKLILEANLKM